MKKIILLVLFTLVIAVSSISAQSYIDNQYQKLAREYTTMSETAFDEGEYDRAIEYSLVAEENAELSEIYIAEMLAKYEANTRIIFAKSRILYGQSLKADISYPEAFETSKKALDNAELAYDIKNWATATSYAEEALIALGGIKGIFPLPQYYIVTDSVGTNDCYWNIAAQPQIYNDPFLWKDLYQANKGEMVDPNNPDLIYPGMRMLIPSLNGEVREGIYSPAITYDTYGK